MLTVDFARFPVDPGDRVLDMGCGGGRHAFALYRRGAHVVALDRSAGDLADVEAMRTALAAARRKGSEIVVYPQAQHGFHADYRASYDAGAAVDGWSRMLLHFAANKVAPKA